MFGFRKKSKADLAIAALPQAIRFAAEKWVFFGQTLKFKDEVPLASRIASFMVPIEQGIRVNIKALKDAPDGVILLVVAKGIEKSGTHTRAQIEEALGLSLPD